VGFLDSFWDSKGVVDPSGFRQVAAPIVPLVRMPKRVYTSAETFVGKVEFANFSQKPLTAVATKWELRSPEGLIAEGILPAVDIPIGACHPVGEIQAALSSATKPTVVTLTLTAGAAKNSWRIWIVPPAAVVDAEGVLVTSSLREAKASLSQGGRVIYTPVKSAIRQRQDTGFLPSFWSPVYFTNQAGTMGLLIDNKHPALSDFPTAEHTDWQWWSILMPSPGAVVLDQVGLKSKPIVQVIDAFSRNQKLGLVFEARVGGGHLIVCAADFSDVALQDPMRRQLRSSLLRYLEKTKTQPPDKLSEAQLDKLFQEVSDQEKTVHREWSKDLEPPPPKK
jgi:hypothetical protein